MEFLDRSTYRMYSDTSLQEMARYNPSAELAIVLGERLEEVQAEFDERLEEARENAADLQIDLNQLDDKNYLLQSEIARNESTISNMAAEIAYLKEQNA